MKPNVEMVQSKITVANMSLEVIYLLVIVILFTTSCQSNLTPDLHETGNTDVDILPLFVTAEDLGWSSGYYGVENGVEFPIVGTIQPEEVWRIHVSPIANTGSRKNFAPDDMRNAGQEVIVFENEAAATQEFNAITQYPLLEGNWQLYDQNIDKRIDNMLARCHYFDTSNLGRLESCDALIQYGRYYMSLTIVIDGNITTKQDWATLFTVAQERLVEFVAQES